MTTNPYYVPTGSPGTQSAGSSSVMRAEFIAVAAGFALLPTLSGAAGAAVVVNSLGTALTTTTGALALAGNLTTTGAFNTTIAQVASVTVTLPAVSGTLATLAGVETLSNKTLVAPALGTPVSGILTNCTLPNLTGPITSNGNATAITSQTGTGTTFVMNTSPTLVTPVLGVASATTLGVAASTLLAAPINIPQGTAPSAPNNGDIWTTLTGVFAQIAGSTVGPLAGAQIVAALALPLQAEQTSGFNATAGKLWPVNIAASGTVTFPASAANGDVIGVFNYGAGIVTFSWNGLKYYGSSASLGTNAKGLSLFIYTGTTTGWVDL